MQTPPPTSSSASKRRAQQAQVARLVKDSAARGGRMSPPKLKNTGNADAQNAAIDASPGQFPGLQFSPDGFAFPMSGPATAPVYPQHKLFWDPDQGEDMMNMDFSADDTFGFGMRDSKMGHSFIQTNEHVNMGHSSIAHFYSHSLAGLEAGGLSTAPEPSLPVQRRLATPTKGNFEMHSSQTRSANPIINPNLLFSSPGNPTLPVDHSSSMHSAAIKPSQPYAHQIQDALMEKEIEHSRKLKRRRDPETDSPAVQAALKALRSEDSEDSTDSRRLARRSSNGSRSRPHGANRVSFATPLGKEVQIRLSSNVRQLSQDSSAHSGSRRSSVTFTIDANGKAKAEAQIGDDPGPLSTGQMEDSEETDSSSSEDEDLRFSHANSFAYPTQRNVPKIGQFDNGSRSHSHQSSLDSNPISRNRRSSERVPFPRQSQMTGTFSSFGNGMGPKTEDDMEIEDHMEDTGDARNQLKKVLQQKSQSAGQRPSQSSFRASRGPQRGTNLSTSITARSLEAPMEISPTTITDPGMASPSTGRSSQFGDGIRCVCHSNDSDEILMILW